MLRTNRFILAMGAVLCLPLAAFAQRGDNLTMGNPSGATTSVSNEYNYLMVKSQYALSYNNYTCTPNWVSWHLNTSWLGSTGRTDAFAADTTLPSGWYRVGSSSYSGSGFDRGHMCPSADRTGSSTDNRATFLMTNMIPQAPNNNQRAWANFENRCRDVAKQGNELFIICGPQGSGGTGSNGYKTWIDQDYWVLVPRRTWKVVMVLPNSSSNDVARVTTSTKCVAINMPNDQTVGSSYSGYYTTVDAIESLTGYNFFSNVSSSIQAAIESKVNSL